MVWIVGNRKRFNEEGIVPVNSTRIDFSHREWEKGWHSTEVIAIASAISGLFHDLGKAFPRSWNRPEIAEAIAITSVECQPFSHSR